MLRFKTVIGLIVFVFFVNTNIVSGSKGPKLIFPTKGVYLQKIDPVFSWKYQYRYNLSYEIMIATDPSFSKDLLVLKSYSPQLHLTIPYLKPGHVYFWSVRALYIINGQEYTTNWSHQDKKDINYCKFIINEKASGYNGSEPVIVSPVQNSIVNTLKPEFKWVFPCHHNTEFLIKNNKGVFVSPAYKDVKYRLIIARTGDYKNDYKIFEVKEKKNLRITIPYFVANTDYYWGVKAIYTDPFTGKVKETSWSKPDTLQEGIPHFTMSDSPQGSFGFEVGMKEELFDPYKIESVEKLTNEIGNSFSPAISMDGRKLAFCSDRLGHIEIFIKNLDEKIGGGATQKTISPQNKMNFNPFWLSDDQEVAFYSNRYRSDVWHLFTTNKGTGVTIQTLGMDMKENPDSFNLYGSCSTDGKLVYTVKFEKDGLYYLYLLDPEDESKTQLKPGMFPDIRNDNKIVYCSNETGNYEIIMVDLEGRSVYRATFLTSDLALDYDPAFSPDGTRIAFTSTRSGNSDIWLMNTDGTNLVQVTFHPLVDRRPQWIDNETIVFQSNRTLGKMESPYSIFIN